jgi:hypothetical protein
VINFVCLEFRAVCIPWDVRHNFVKGHYDLADDSLELDFYLI